MSAESDFSNPNEPEYAAEIIPLDTATPTTKLPAKPLTIRI
jgi:hypothetical protein